MEAGDGRREESGRKTFTLRRGNNGGDVVVVEGVVIVAKGREGEEKRYWRRKWRWRMEREEVH